MQTVNPAAAKVAVAADPATEIVLLEARLSPRWRTWRFWTCSASCLHLFPVLSPLYLLCGASCRQEEADSFRLTLTAHSIDFQQMLFTCGCCCKSVTTKSIPLDKVQDVMLKGDCCGDCCGCSEGGLKPYQLHIQTAGSSGGENSAAELSVYCACAGVRGSLPRAARSLTPHSLPHTALSPLLLRAQAWRTWRAFAGQSWAPSARSPWARGLARGLPVRGQTRAAATARRRCRCCACWSASRLPLQRA